MDAEQLAHLFHETYERLAPDSNYQTRKASAVPWTDVPANNKNLMIAVAREVLAHLQAEEQPIRIWATKTELEGTDYERKQYFVILEDEGKPDLRFILQRHAPYDAIGVAPYVPADYDYTQYDGDEEELGNDDDGWYPDDDEYDPDAFANGDEPEESE